MRPRLLELFCGRGGWSKAFSRRDWHCVGVDIAALGYPFEFIQADALSLSPEFINSFDGVVMSPPCEEFARAWLPWLRGDGLPAAWALNLLQWSIALCDRPGRLVECSNFAAKHAPGAVRIGSYSLWGDVPLLVSEFPRRKSAQSGTRPDIRAEIPHPLADAVADWFTSGRQAVA